MLARPSIADIFKISRRSRSPIEYVAIAASLHIRSTGPRGHGRYPGPRSAWAPRAVEE
jgi:hypothetical protein